MPDSIAHVIPGQAAAAGTKAELGAMNSANKIAEASTLGQRVDGVLTRTVTAAGDAQGLMTGLVDVLCGEAITAGTYFMALANGKAGQWLPGYAKAGILLGTGADGSKLPALIPAPEGQAGNPDAIVAVTADGAIAVPQVNTTYFVTKSGAAAMTLVDPTADTHDGVRLTFIATLAQADTLDNSAGSGFSGVGAGADIGTFGGAIADYISIIAYQGIWWELENHNVTLA